VADAASVGEDFQERADGTPGTLTLRHCWLEALAEIKNFPKWNADAGSIRHVAVSDGRPAFRSPTQPRWAIVVSFSNPMRQRRTDLNDRSLRHRLTSSSLPITDDPHCP